jgi:hypothetical protein
MKGSGVKYEAQMPGMGAVKTRNFAVRLSVDRFEEIKEYMKRLGVNNQELAEIALDSMLKRSPEDSILLATPPELKATLAAIARLIKQDEFVANLAEDLVRNFASRNKRRQQEVLINDAGQDGAGPGDPVIPPVV